MIRQVIRRKVTFYYREPMQNGSLDEWDIPAKPTPVDRRTRESLRLSYGTQVLGGVRDVSLCIGNAVAVLDPLSANALLKLLLDAHTDATHGASKRIA